MHKILFFHDNSETIEITKNAIEKMGFEYHQSSSKEEIIELSKRYSPRLILLDITASYKEGLQIIKTLKRKTIKTLVIVIAPFKSEEDLRRVLRLGIADYIRKPFQLIDLQQKIRTVLELDNLKNELKNSEERFQIISRFWASAIVRDISERKIHEAALLKSEQYSKSIIRAIPDIIIRYNKEGVYLDIISSKSPEKLLLPFEKMIGRKVTEILPQEVAEKILARIRSSLAKNSLEVSVHELEIKGEQYWFEARIVPVQKDEVISIIRDVTRKKLYTKKLKQKHMELEEVYSKLAKEINKAKFLHEKSLPRKITNLEDISFSAYYKPAQKLGGDFYDIIKEGDKLVFYISDVTGHGMEAAILSSFLKEAFNSYISLQPANIQPDKILAHIDRQFRKENFLEDYFICIFVAVIELNTKKMTFCNAGIHEPPLINEERLGGGGLPISTTIPEELVEYTNQSILLKEGDTLLLTTDGLPEQMVGEDRFENIMAETFHKNIDIPPILIKKILNKEFAKFNKSLQGDDDITYIVMQVNNGRKGKSFLLESKFSELDRIRKIMEKNLGEGFEHHIMALHELVANAIEHGNKFAETKKVKVELEYEKKYIIFTVTDEGEGFNWIDKLNKKIELEGITDRSRGIALCELLSEHILYNTKGNKCSILLKRYPAVKTD